MSANRFVLKGAGIEVDYTIGATPGLPSLVYTDGAFQETFKANEILVEDTGLGEMISVALIRTIDTGGERFGFFRALTSDKARMAVTTRIDRILSISAPRRILYEVTYST